MFQGFKVKNININSAGTFSYEFEPIHTKEVERIMSNWHEDNTYYGNEFNHIPKHNSATK